MERTILVWSDRNIRDQLRKWSTLTGPVISIGRTELTKLLSPVLLFCILLTITITMSNVPVAWVGSVQPECMFHWARGISEISNRFFFFLLHGSARNLIHEEKHAACSYRTAHQRLSLGVYENEKNFVC